VQKIEVVVKKTGAPRARLAKGEPVTSSKGAYEFSVTYTAESPLAIETIGLGDIRIIGPGGFQQFPEPLAVKPAADAQSATVTYRATPWGGNWYTSSNGTYTIEMKGWHVGDDKGRYVAEGILGTFTVNVKESEPAGQKPPTSAPDELPKKKKMKPKNSGKKKKEVTQKP
jgi:hypothetical protein